MFKSMLVVMQFIDVSGNRSQPFVVNPNQFSSRVEGFDDEMLQDTLVLVLADCEATDSGGFAMSGISSFPVVTCSHFRDLSVSSKVYGDFSDHQQIGDSPNIAANDG